MNIDKYEESYTRMVLRALSGRMTTTRPTLRRNREVDIRLDRCSLFRHTTIN